MPTVAQGAHARAAHRAWASCLPAQEGFSPLLRSPGEQNQPLKTSWAMGRGRELGAEPQFPLQKVAIEGSLRHLRAPAVPTGEEGQSERALVARVPWDGTEDPHLPHPLLLQAT